MDMDATQDYKKSKAPVDTITRNLHDIEQKTGNIYEAIVIVAKRANQINKEMKAELDRKLEEFAYYADNFEEIFENREQIEISKFYERLPKPTSIALDEFMNDRVYYRNPNKPQKNQ
jgi:DNA-directed RNA polymerase subunit K/omega